MERQIWILDGKRVFCTRIEYLFLKMYYSKDGLTMQEYEEYKRYQQND